MFTNENPPHSSPFYRENSQPGDDLLESSSNVENPLPKFSIRDFVSQNRVRDLKNNWPFSQESLQFCLKNEVDDVLPPFQSLDSLRNRGKLTKIASLKEKAAGVVENVASFELEGDEEFPSRARSILVSALNSVSPKINPEERTEFAVLKSNKSSIRSIDKKRRFPVADRITKEDSAVNSSMASETMASQVCPVCKSFSSCSNTTLNAHIDQCLSVVPLSSSQACEKASKHKIKRRRIRLMVDIYETAFCYTLEDLDRRNGTNWASNLSELPENSEAVAEEHDKVQASSIRDKDDVFIDSNGMKLRILSRVDGRRSEERSKGGGSEPTELDDGECGNRSLLAKKRKHLVQKLKLPRPACGQWGGSANSTLNHQIRATRLTRFSPDVSKKGLVKPRKKKVMKDSIERVVNVKLKNALPSPRDEVLKRKSSSISASFFDEDHPLASDSSKTDSDSSFSYSDECLEPLSVRSVGFLSLKRKDDKRRMPSWRIPKESPKDNLSVNGGHEDSQNSTQSLLSSVKRKAKISGYSGSICDGKKLSPLGKSLICSSGSDEEGVLVSQSTIHRNGKLVETTNKHQGQLEKSSSNPSVISSKRLAPVSTHDGSLKTSCESDVSNPGKTANTGYKGAHAFSFRDEGERSNKVPCEPIHEVARDASHSSYNEINGSLHCVVAYNPSDILLCQDSVTPNHQLLVQKDDALEAPKDSCPDVAPILIPEPPGCFLPSPGHVSSDELQANSSLTTCRPPSDDEQGTVDTNSLNTNAVAIAEKLHAYSHAQYPTRVSVLETRNSSAVEDCTLSEKLVGAEKQVNSLISPQVIRKSFCSREDAALQNAPPNYPGSHFYGELAEQCDYQACEDYIFSPKSRSPHDAWRNPEAQRNESHSNAYPLMSSRSHSEAMLPALGNFKSSPEPASNPVLRLMGKNLMVTSKYDNLSRQTKCSETSLIRQNCVDNPCNINSLTPSMKTGIPVQLIRYPRSDGFAAPAHFPHPMVGRNYTGHHGSESTLMDYDCANRRGLPIPEQQLGSIIRPDACRAYVSGMMNSITRMPSEAAWVRRCHQMNAQVKHHDPFRPVLPPRPSLYFPQGFS